MHEQQTFSEATLDAIDQAWREFGASLLNAFNQCDYARQLGHVSSLAYLIALFVGMRQLAVALLWLPFLLFGTVAGLALVLVLQLLPFIGVGLMFWIGYSVLFSPPQTLPPLPERPVYHPADVENYPPTGFPAEAEAETP
jgi:hypothetical protein